jgi:DNA-binding transcriptional ArsR family regulator
MDRHYTSGEAARALGTSVPRVLRAARRGAVPTVSRGNRTMFLPEAVEQLRRRWGWAPPIPGLRREEVMALAALSRRPLGLASARALGRAAGLSPTTAAHVLRRLHEAGYVDRSVVSVVEGRVRRLPVWTVRFGSPEWLVVAGRVGATVLPLPPRRDRPRRVPRRLGHLFWNEDLDRLRLDRHASLVAGRILRADDPEGLAWAREGLPPGALEAASRSRGLDPRRARLGMLLARSP